MKYLLLSYLRHCDIHNQGARSCITTNICRNPCFITQGRQNNRHSLITEQFVNKKGSHGVVSPASPGNCRTGSVSKIYHDTCTIDSTAACCHIYGLNFHVAGDIGIRLPFIEKSDKQIRQNTNKDIFKIVLAMILTPFVELIRTIPNSHVI